MFSYTANRNFARYLFLTLAGFGVLFALLYFEILNLGLFILFFAIFLIFLNLYYYRVVNVPLKHVSDQVAAVLAGNEYSKVKVGVKDEFGLIAHFFNEVTENLEGLSFELKEGERMASELSLASEIQASVLPKSIPTVPGLDTVAKTRPADEVGGDSFAIKKHGDEYYIYIGDVTGHGAPAGLIMMMVNTLFDVYLPSCKNTQELAVTINQVLKPRVNSSMFMTTVFFRWNAVDSKLYYTGAGHEHILIYRASEGVCEAIASGGIALAMAEDISQIVKEKELPLSQQDIVVLYSDGITEATNESGELYGLERLKSALKQYGHLGYALDVFEGISDDITRFTGNSYQKDDMTLIVMRYSGAETVSGKENLVSTNWSESELKA